MQPLPIWYLASRWGLGLKVCMHHFGCGVNWIKGYYMIVKKKTKLLIFNFFNGNAFLNIVILYYLLMRRDIWFKNHLVIFLIDCINHFQSYFLQQTPIEIGQLVINIGAVLKGCKNNRKQRNYLLCLTISSNLVFVSSDSFCLIPSYILKWTWLEIHRIL